MLQSKQVYLYFPSMDAQYLLDAIKRLNRIADIGLLYGNNEFDKERYQELKEISLELLSKASGHNLEALKISLPSVSDYPTPKVDVRGLVLSPDNKILLAKESADGKWSLPGGWADIGQTPTEVIVKECKEETGLDVTPLALLAIFDKRMHPHPPQPFYIYKLVFYCKAISHNMQKGFDVLDVGYFDVHQLPELSEDRILKSQIALVYNKVLQGDMVAYVD